MYASLPRHFTMELAVKTVEQEPDLVAERRELLASKSVSELSQVTDRKNRNVFDLSLRSNPLPTSQCLILCNVPSTKALDRWEAANPPKIHQNHRQQGKVLSKEEMGDEKIKPWRFYKVPTFMGSFKGDLKTRS